MSFLSKIFKPRTRTVLMFGPATTTLPIGARKLIGNEAFKAAFMEASAFVERERGWSPWRELDNDGSPQGVHSAERNFVEETVFQLCLFRAFSGTGQRFDAVAGISLGDCAAGFASGALTFEQALHVMCETVVAVGKATGGDLLAVQAPPNRVREIIGASDAVMIFDWSVLSVWAVPDECARLMQRRLRAARVAYTKLGFECLSHTDRIDSALLTERLSDLPELVPATSYYSTLEGGLVARAPIPRRRWARAISEPVRLDEMWKQLRSDGFTDIVYIGSMPADTDLFGPLAKELQPTSFRRAESFISIAPVAKLHRNGHGELSSDIETTFRSTAFARDPYPFFRKWLSEGSVHPANEEKLFDVFGYDATASIFKQPAKFSAELFKGLSKSLGGADPPEHTRVRKVLNPYFTRERMLQNADRIREVTRFFLSSCMSKGEFDFVSDFAAALPFVLSCTILGLDEQDSAILGAALDEELAWDDVARALKPEGVIPSIVANNEMSHEDLLGMVPFLIGAGVMTMRDLLCFALHHLMSEPEIVARMIADKTLIAPVIEELIRLEPAAQGDARVAREDTVVDGVPIPKGSIIWMWLGAANRDPSRFEDPDSIIIGREGTRHISFGAGPHFCLGSHLSRIEAEIVFEEIVDLIPRLREVSPPDFGWADMRGGRPVIPVFRSMRSWRLKIES